MRSQTPNHLVVTSKTYGGLRGHRQDMFYCIYGNSIYGERASQEIRSWFDVRKRDGPRGEAQCTALST